MAEGEGKLVKVSVRLPKALVSKIDAQADASLYRQTRSDVIRKALAEYYQGHQKAQ